MEETRIEDASAEDPIIEDAIVEDLEEIDTIIAELEVSKGRGNLILCVVNAPAYRDRIIRVLKDRFPSKLIHVNEGEDVIQNLKSGDFGSSEVLIWKMPEQLTEDLADALNNFRELYYDAGVPSIVFLSRSFLDDVIRRAPDFWRYRGNYYELEGSNKGSAFEEAIDALATSLRYQNKEDLLRRKRIDEYLLEKVKDEIEATKILDELGKIYYDLGDYDNASKYFTLELRLCEKIDYKWGFANSMHQLGMVAQARGEIDEARRLYDESLKIFLDLGDKNGAACSMHHLGWLAHDIGEIDEARHLYDESLKISRDLGDRIGVSASLHHHGLLAQDIGEIDEARHLYAESLKIKQELGYKIGIAITSAQLALLEEHEGKLEKALDLIRRAEALFTELGSPKAERTRKVRERLEKTIANEQMSEGKKTAPRRPDVDER